MDEIVGQPQAPKSKSYLILIVIILAIVAIVGGAAAGILLKGPSVSNTSNVADQAKTNSSGPPLPQQDEKTFRDKAEGTIEKNEVDDPYAQGTHKLIREGGESQSAHLVSSVVDLDQYVGKKVEVFGETNQSEEVGWLMDVGRVNELQ
ncbi:MAG TPA: hypothetical protein VIK81_01345 [Patescibacteria group bacterium]